MVLVVGQVDHTFALKGCPQQISGGQPPSILGWRRLVRVGFGRLFPRRSLRLTGFLIGYVSRERLRTFDNRGRCFPRSEAQRTLRTLKRTVCERLGWSVVAWWRA